MENNVFEQVIVTKYHELKSKECSIFTRLSVWNKNCLYTTVSYNQFRSSLSSSYAKCITRGIIVNFSQYHFVLLIGSCTAQLFCGLKINLLYFFFSTMVNLQKEKMWMCDLFEIVSSRNAHPNCNLYSKW